MKREKPNKVTKVDSYTDTEVGTLLEEIRSNVKRVAEGHTGLDKRLEDIEVSNQEIKDRLNMVEISNSIIKDKVFRLEDAASKLLTDLRETRQELKTDVTNLRQELKIDIASLKVDLKSDIKELGDRLNAVEARP